MVDLSRRAAVPAFAKINLDLTVLNKRSDGFHDLRTVFQTVSLADRISIRYTPAADTEYLLESAVDIPDNLIVRAARGFCEATGVRGRFSFRLDKKIPIGGGMGGGSSDAAAILLALPALTGRSLPLAELHSMAAALGSDVPFFLTGGTALGLGRGEEIYPLEDLPEFRLLIVAPEVHVATPEAFSEFARDGNGKLTDEEQRRYIGRFQSRVLGWGASLSAGAGRIDCENDFERVIFPKYPQLKSTLQQLQSAGAATARMTGSGAALFGIFPSAVQARLAMDDLGSARAFPARTISRRRYYAHWWRALQEHMDAKAWPPRSRYAQ